MEDKPITYTNARKQKDEKSIASEERSSLANALLTHFLLEPRLWIYRPIQEQMEYYTLIHSVINQPLVRSLH